MSQPSDPASRLPVVIERHDQLKIFANEPCWAKLGALLITTAPRLLIGAGLVLLGLAKFKGWL